MSGKTTVTIIENGLVLYDNNAGEGRGIFNMTKPSTQAMNSSINVSANALGYAQIGKDVADVAQTKSEMGMAANEIQYRRRA